MPKHGKGMVRCGDHGWRLAYIVCIHVFTGRAEVARIEEAAPDDPGVIECEVCAETDWEVLGVENWRPVCQRCARHNGWIPAA